MTALIILPHKKSLHDDCDQKQSFKPMTTILAEGQKQNSREPTNCHYLQSNFYSGKLRRSKNILQNT